MKKLMYVGGYTNEKNVALQIFEADTKTGAFRKIREIPDTINSTYLCLSRDNTRLYAGISDPKEPKGKNGAVAVFAVNGDNLTLQDIKSVGPVTAPCYVALDPSEKALVWAEYSNATYGVCELDEKGRLTDKQVRLQNFGDGPNKPRQDKAHAHCAKVTPDGKYLCVVDLGIDRVTVLDFVNRADGLKVLTDKTVHTAPGLGPRHLVFHPNGKFAFLLYELGSAVSSFRYTGDAFVPVQTLSMLPGDFKGTTKAAAIKISEDGLRLFASNRGHDSIAVYNIDPETGALTLLAINKLVGAFPRDFTFMPEENFAVIGHKMSDELMTYAYNRATGALTPMNNAQKMYHPVCIVFGAQIG